MAELSFDSGFLNIQGAPLYYEVAGQGPALLFIHAGIADCRMWDEQFEFFARQYRVVRYDLRGFGQSKFPAGPFANYEDILALLNHLEIEQTHLVGISYGGKIALDFTLTHPERVSSLVLVATSVGGHKPPAEVVQFVEKEEQLLEQGDVEGATELNLQMWVDGPLRSPDQVNPAVRRRVHDMLLPVIATPEPEGVHEIELDPPTITRLSQVQKPTLVIVGDHDIADKITMAGQVAAEIPGAQQVVIPGPAHMVSMEEPEEFNRIVLSFLTTTV